VNYTRDQADDHSTSFSVGVDMRPSTFLHVTLGPNLGIQHSTGQYVRSVTDALATSTYGSRYVFADLGQTTLAMDTRVEWTFTPALSLQVYAQPFVSAGRYSSFKEFKAPRTYDFAVYGVDRGTIARSAAGIYTVDPDGAGPARPFTFANPNFTNSSVRGTGVLRWEYRPGSTLYLVWTQERSGYDPTGTFDFGSASTAIFRGSATNVFQIKATYWLGR